MYLHSLLVKYIEMDQRKRLKTKTQLFIIIMINYQLIKIYLDINLDYNALTRMLATNKRVGNAVDNFKNQIR